jgi:rubrerythrin
MAQLRAQNEELMHINSEWDKEYREQSEAFRRYQFDAQQAQTENHTIIARLKEKIASLEEERDRLDDELARYRREGHALRERLAVAESMKSATGGAALEEEVALLRQQVKAYQEDFEAEKRDKEQMRDEKHRAAIKYEAEKTSLQLQLDRCQTDLAHFTSEANRLAQQLKLKSQYEEDRYRKHLESKGFVSRSPGDLPPLDPFVEIDQNVPALPPRSLRHHELVMQNGINGHDHTLPNGTRSNADGGMSSPVRRRISTNATHLGSFRLVPRGIEDEREVSSAPATVNSSTDTSSCSSSDSSVVDSDGALPLPLVSKGKHVCPRCARRFQEKRVFQQHKDRCLS